MERTIELKGRVDSSNAAEVEERIKAELDNYAGSLNIDVEELEYISSAGLRILLRLKKTYSDIHVINCNAEVYEILDMTGFTAMMDVVKAYRRLSVDGCQVIGEGANGIVYRTDPDTIVKVYKNRDALEEIHNERELARKAFVMGIPTAIPYDVVRVGDLYGSVFELLSAKSFAQLLKDGADVATLAKDSADILKTIHGTMLKDGELPNKREEAIGWAKFCVPHLPEETGKRLMELFEGIPDTNNMVHGDYHVKNIMQQDGENLLIDMDTLSMGHPIFEFAAIYAAYVGFSCVDKDQAHKFLGITVEQSRDFWKYTLSSYFEGKSEEYIEDVQTKAALICYTRILRRTMRRVSPDAPDYKPLIDFCTEYLIENVPKVDNLYFDVI